MDDLIFWTNGGPGCSSLEGLLQENGPFSWIVGTAKPIVNQYSWTNLSSLLYVEQPVGTGFSQGKPNAKDENDVAAQLVGFFQQFLSIFSELENKKFYLTGESVRVSFNCLLHSSLISSFCLLSTQEPTSLVSGVDDMRVLAMLTIYVQTLRTTSTRTLRL